MRQLCKDRALAGDGLYHLAAGEEGRHGVQQLLASVQHSDAHGAVHFMAGEGQKVRAQRLHVHRDMGRTLRRVHDHDRARAVRKLRYLADGVHPAQDIGDMRTCHDLRPRRDERGDFVEIERPVRLTFHELQRRAGPAADHLPRQEVAVMLHDGHQHLVPGLDVRKPVAVRHEVQPLGGVARKNYLAAALRVQKVADGVARTLIALRRGDAERI